MPYYFRLPLITDLTTEQQAALNEVGPIAISGGPGTGKSLVSLWRHIRNYDLGNRRSLLLTYTKTLETYLAANAKSENENAGDAVNRTYWWTTHKDDVRYDEIIVDEAQDVEVARYDIVKKFAEIVSFGADDQQILFPNKSTSEAELANLFPGNTPFELFENFRNSYEIIQFVRSLFTTRLIPQATINNLLQENRRGPKPFLEITNKDKAKQNQVIIDIINQFRAETHNIAILVPLQKHVDAFSTIIRDAGIPHTSFKTEDGHLNEIDNVHVTTFKSCKGAEFDTVIIPDFQNMHWNIANFDVVEENDYYVALTRAKRNLYLISSTDLAFINQTTIQKEIL